VELEKPKQIAPRLVNYMMTGDPDGKNNEEHGKQKAACSLRGYGWW
jgi:hypothetical protein